MKQISIFAHCFPPAKGGTEYLVGEIKKMLDSRYTVHVFTGKGTTLDSYKTFSHWISDKSDSKSHIHRLNLRHNIQRLSNKLLNKLIFYIPLFSPFYFGPLLQFNKTHEEIIQNSDLIIGFAMPTMTFYYAYHFAKKYKKPLILHPSYHDVSYYNNCIFFQKTLDYASKIIYQTPKEKHDLVKNYTIDTDKLVQLAFSPFHTKDIQKQQNNITSLLQKTKKRFKQKKVTLGYIGQIVERKNLTLLAKYFYRFENYWKKKNWKISIILAGAKTNTSKEVEHNFAKLDNITFLYNFDEHTKKHIFENIDIFINPSIEESLGITNFEAIFYGKPILVHSDAAFSEFKNIQHFYSLKQLHKLIIKLTQPKTYLQSIEGQYNMLIPFAKQTYQKKLYSLIQGTI